VLDPHREPFAFAFLQITFAYDRSPRIALKHLSTGFDLIIDIREAREASDGAEHVRKDSQGPWIYVFSVPRDLPTAREDEPCVWLRDVQYGLRGLRCVLQHAV